MLRDVDRVASAMHQSMSDHMASAILRSLPGDVTGPFTRHWSLVIDYSGRRSLGITR
ncbi:hypothetical protein DPMN_058306 [Dreissena polymorpha]|uniref:Uncharacterized protein n=1 Tax=Dreissena polymorpha TaxID=45954 RepID=A0A9D4HFC7_DREPO|nr:hypothetical protein DPMN_058306 [Dreissena polymorpha]